jgi:hypothetical protein
MFDWIRAWFDRSRSFRDDQSSTSVYAQQRRWMMSYRPVIGL